MPLEIWIPDSAREQAEHRLVYICRLCGLKLPRPEQREQFIRHCASCAKKNADKIEAEVAKHNNAFTGRLDPERHDWIHEREERGEKVNYLKDGVIR